MKRPKRREIKFPQRQRFLRKNVTKEELEEVAGKALYAPSNYHCKVDGKIVRRVKPQTPCRRDFTLPEAGRAVREAILKGRVSEEWVNGFPRRLWHRDGDVWYEACTGVGTAGTYHAYPIEEHSLPVELRR